MGNEENASERLQLVKLTQKRNALIMNVKKLCQRADEFLKQESPDTGEVSVYLGKFTDYRSRLSDISDAALALITDETSIGEEVQKASGIDDQLLDYIEAVKALSIKPGKPLSVDGVASASAAGRDPDTRHAKVRLPKIEIDKFDGDAMGWQSFWDSFSSTIDENADLSDVDKFKYLRSYLKGDALRVTEGYSLTAANYSQVVDALKERFGNPQLAIFSHLSAMIDLQPSSNYEISNLQKIYDSCESHIRSLAALGLDESTFGQVFTPIILSKLPTFVRMELHRRNGHQVWTLTNLRSMLKDEIRARDMSTRLFDGKEGKHKQAQNQKGQANKAGYDKRADHSLPVSDKDKRQRKEREKACVYCGEKHFSDECTKYPDVKARRERIKGQCFNCFSKKHMAKECPVPKRPCVYCQRTGHNRSLCDQKFGSTGSNGGPISSVTVSSLNPSAAPFNPVTANLNHDSCVNLQTAVVEIRDSGHRRKCKARILFDTASSRSFIVTKKAEALGLVTVDTEAVSIAGFEEQKRRQRVYRVVEFDMVLADGTTERISARVTPMITCPVRKHAIDAKQYPFVKSLPLAEPYTDQSGMLNIDILLGGDFYYKIVTDEVIRSSHGLVLLSSKVGYITAGTSLCSPDRDHATHVALHINTVGDSDFDLQKFWKLEELGITDSPKKCAGDEEALLKFQKTTKFKNGRYEVSLPWKSNRPDLPDHYAMCKGRLKSLLVRIKGDRAILKKYSETFEDQTKMGIIERAPTKADGPIHYLPHHCVVKPDSATTKVRVVYDASAKTSVNGVSLNDCLHRGPVMLTDLYGLLLRFRLHGVAVVSDIEKAYHQLSVKPSDRDVLRFLWVKDSDKPVTDDNVMVYRFSRVPFGVISSAFLLDATVRHHVDQDVSGQKTAKLISENLYVDNIIASFPAGDMESNWYNESKALLSTASMNLREFFSNSKTLMDGVQVQDRGSGHTKVLGLTWNVDADTLNCRCKIPVTESIAWTKRLILSRISTLYDPCGFFSPVTLPAKLLMRELWVADSKWDDEVNQEFTVKWEAIRDQLALIPSLPIARHISQLTDRSDVSFELHCFCDASCQAYAAVVYLLTDNNAGEVEVHILFSKTRVRPPEPMTIPKMELLGATIGAQMLQFVDSQIRLPMRGKYLWSDAQCVLHWINNRDQKATVFVANRVKKIREVKDLTVKYVPTDQNHADLASRGCTAGEIQTASIWWHGPAFLKSPPECWPLFKIDVKGTDETEIAPTTTTAEANGFTSTVAVAPEADTSTSLVDFSRFNKMGRLRRTLAWLLRFICNAKGRQRLQGPLSAEELNHASRVLDLQTQRACFTGSIKNLMPGLRPRNLNVFKDDKGMIRCRSRLDHSDLDLNDKYPVLLPRKHPYTRLVIEECHERAGHTGVSQTLAKVRESYWIPRGRSEVKGVPRDCRLCRRLEGGPYRIPDQPPLPDFRVSGREPFACSGVDYLGPIYIKKENATDQKVWIVLFTCALIRAIHLEVVEDMTTQEFLMAFRRFIALYGTPKLIVSDNAKQFKTVAAAANKIWQNVVVDGKVQVFAAETGMKWKFITEKAPWMGGFYERLVGLVKRTLRRLFFNRRLMLREVQTLAAEASAIINSRPLVQQDDDLSNHPLTPAHFLLKGNPSRRLQDQPFEDEYLENERTHDPLYKVFRRTRSLLNEFWKIFASEYLQNLKERAPPRSQRNAVGVVPSLGDVVLVKDKDVKRSEWKLGRVVMLFESTDGLVRSASIKFPSGTVARRPIKLLYPLEFAKVEWPTDSDNQDVPPDADQGRPRRAAAVKAKQKIQQMASEEVSQASH